VAYGSLVVFAFQKQPAHIVCFLTALPNTIFYAIALRPLSLFIFPDLKPTMKTISLRLPEQMLNRIKVLANERDVPYQSLLKMFLKERIDREYEPKRNRPRSSRKANA
jgi:hypothetical protein